MLSCSGWLLCTAIIVSSKLHGWYLHHLPAQCNLKPQSIELQYGQGKFSPRSLQSHRVGRATVKWSSDINMLRMPHPSRGRQSNFPAKNTKRQFSCFINYLWWLYIGYLLIIIDFFVIDWEILMVHVLGWKTQFCFVVLKSRFSILGAVYLGISAHFLDSLKTTLQRRLLSPFYTPHLTGIQESIKTGVWIAFHKAHRAPHVFLFAITLQFS